MALTYAEVDALAERAHAQAGSVDKLGVPTISHARAVAAGLEPFGEELKMAGVLHDVLEDTEVTPEELTAAGVPDRVVELVVLVTKQPDVGYPDMIKKIAADPGAALIKISDGAHNCLPERVAQLDSATRDRLNAKYKPARRVLYQAVRRDQVTTILNIVNPALLGELDDLPTDPPHS